MMYVRIYYRKCGVVANVLDCDIIISEIELQSHYYVHFQTNILEKVILQAIS